MEIERQAERERKQRRDGHPSLHSWIRGYRDIDRLKTWLTLLKPCTLVCTPATQYQSVLTAAVYLAVEDNP